MEQIKVGDFVKGIEGHVIDGGIMMVYHFNDNFKTCFCKGWSKITGKPFRYEIDRNALVVVPASSDTRLKKLFEECF